MATAAALTENSRQGFEVQKPPGIGLAAELSRNPRRGCGHAYDETASDLAVYVRNDPINFADRNGKFTVCYPIPEFSIIDELNEFSSGTVEYSLCGWTFDMPLLSEFIDWSNYPPPQPTQPPEQPPCDPDGYRVVTPEEGAAILSNAKTWEGVPYVPGGKTRKGVDCSGFVYAAVNEVGIPFSYRTTSQYQAGLELQAVAVSQIQAGDIIHFPGHVGFYDPNPATPGNEIYSARSGAGKVTEGEWTYFGGKDSATAFRVRIPCGWTVKGRS